MKVKPIFAPQNVFGIANYKKGSMFNVESTVIASDWFSFNNEIPLFSSK